MLRRGEGPRRLLTTVLFTDIVGSTERAAALGDRGWKDLVARHHAVVRRQLHRFHGHEVDTAGDGFFATFDRPAQAIECATAIIDDLRPLDLRIRAAIHMGEAEVMGGKVGGLTVHVASRALAEANPNEILVTSTIREVAAGADVTFSDRGVHEFKGVPGEWHLYGVEWQRRELPTTAPGAPAAADRQAAARRRTWWLAAVATGLAGVVLLAATAALLPRDDAVAPEPQPDSAIAFDTTTSAATAVVPAGDTPTGIAIADGTAWVLGQGSRTLTGIPLAGGTPSTTGLPGAPTGIAAGDGSVWVTFGYGAAEQSAGMVLRLSAADPTQTDRIPAANGVSAIALGEGGVWVTNEVANTLVKIDPATRSEMMTVTVGEKPVAVATGEGSLWVAHVLDRTLWRIDPATLRKTAEISLRDAPTSIAIAFGRVWVTSTVGNTVTVIDAASNGLADTIPVDVGPQGIAAGADAIWVAGGRNALVRIDPESRTVSRSIDLPGPAEGVAVSGENVWVTVQR